MIPPTMSKIMIEPRETHKRILLEKIPPDVSSSAVSVEEIVETSSNIDVEVINGLATVVFVRD